MKNLKRVLALGLAIMMLFGCMMIAGAADAETTKVLPGDLKDLDTVKNVNEVSLLVDLGVINGIKEGDVTNYKPEGNIDRASWAKMVYTVLEGDAPASYYVGTVNSLRDIAGNWAEGQISYLVSNGYANGDDQKNFNPSSNIRVDEACKIMLTSLGYDSEDRGYVGDSWSGSIMRDARRYGLMNGVTAAANTPLTRDDAAKIITNALNAGMVEASYARFGNGANDKYVSEYVNLNTTLGYSTYGLGAVTGVITDVKGGKAVIDGDETEFAATADQIGQSVTYYAKFTGATFTMNANHDVTADYSRATAVSVISSGLVAGASTVIATVTDGLDVNNATWYTKTKDSKTFVAEIEKDTNGNYDTTAVRYTKNGSALGAFPTAAENIASGNKVELVDTDGNGLVDLVRSYAYTVKAIGAKGVKSETDKEGNVTWTVDGITADAYVGHEDLKAGDLVLYYTVTKDKKDTAIIEKAEAKAVTATNFDSDGNVLVGKDVYVKSNLTDTSSIKWGSAYEYFKKEVTFLLDKAGDVLAVDPGEVEAEKNETTIIGLASAWVPGTAGLNGTAGYLEAQILMIDEGAPTATVVKVAKIDSAAVTDKSAVTKWGWYTAEKNDDESYNLTAVTPDKTLKDAAIDAKIAFTTSESANNNTKFIVAKGPDAKGAYAFSSYTGYRNVPAMEKASGSIIYTEKTNTAAQVLLVTDSFKGDASGELFMITSTKYVGGENGGVVMSIMNAAGETEEKTLEIDKTVAEGLKIGKFYTVAGATEKGVVSKVSEVEAKNIVEFKSMAAGVLTAGSDGKTVYEYDDDTTVILINLTNDAAAFVSAAKVDDVTVDTDHTWTCYVIAAAGVANTVYVIATANA